MVELELKFRMKLLPEANKATCHSKPDLLVICSHFYYSIINKSIPGHPPLAVGLWNAVNRIIAFMYKVEESMFAPAAFLSSKPYVVFSCFLSPC
jgi:hypothetical protein